MRYFTVWESGICTPCGQCVFVCPKRDRDKPGRKGGQHGAAAVATTGERELAFLIVRRQNGGRQRRRLLVDLRRQSAGDVLKLILAGAVATQLCLYC